MIRHGSHYSHHSFIWCHRISLQQQTITNSILVRTSMLLRACSARDLR
jgi:hypothetical protein